MRAQGDTHESRTALSELCAAYWNPVFHFLRREGRNDDDSRELAQEFFARLLARGGIGEADRSKGRFRSYLLGALKHFLAERRRHEGREKRGGYVLHESLDAPNAEGSAGLEIANSSAAFSDKYFDREWAHAIMACSLATVQSSFVNNGKAAQYDVLKAWLVGDTENLSQSAAAAELGISTGAIKVMIHRIRKDFRQAVEAEIFQTVPSVDDIGEELRYLVEVLS